ncbi:hypothetical protein KsCSTR_30360 [Candidatus Kuenenia stuttgartiensis]|uniref:Uncharacterized protein n=1 Tax=Kuenenia stuttgartiensis TaxID=174633 RepID=Q1Q5H2_KUEST|nr:hypothetical protein KsCSTR_30360 [Candidatus Kuenenia stuttgartiensis]CAJ75267.1 unknown protein [Candidatus Kuenenia stuttgartiensis]
MDKFYHRIATIIPDFDNYNRLHQDTTPLTTLISSANPYSLYTISSINSSVALILVFNGSRIGRLSANCLSSSSCFFRSDGFMDTLFLFFLRTSRS